MKLIFLASSFTIIYYMRFHPSVKQTYDAELESFNVLYLLGPAAVLALLVNQEFSFMEVGCRVLAQPLIHGHLQSFPSTGSHTPRLAYIKLIGDIVLNVLQESADKDSLLAKTYLFSVTLNDHGNKGFSMNELIQLRPRGGTQGCKIRAE